MSDTRMSDDRSEESRPSGDNNEFSIHGDQPYQQKILALPTVEQGVSLKENKTRDFRHTGLQPEEVEQAIMSNPAIRKRMHKEPIYIDEEKEIKEKGFYRVTEKETQSAALRHLAVLNVTDDFVEYFDPCGGDTPKNIKNQKAPQFQYLKYSKNKYQRGHTCALFCLFALKFWTMPISDEDRFKILEKHANEDHDVILQMVEKSGNHEMKNLMYRISNSKTTYELVEVLDELPDPEEHVIDDYIQNLSDRGQTA